MNNAATKPCAGQRYGILSLSPLTGNIAFEALLARVLVSEGIEPVFVRCNGGRDRCLVDTINPQEAGRTSLCVTCTDSVIDLATKWSGDPPTICELDAYLAEDRLQAAYAELAKVPDKALSDFVFDGLPLGDWNQTGLRVDHFGEDWQQMPDLIARARGWLRSSIYVAVALDGYLRHERPDAVVQIGGHMPWERVAKALADRYGIRCVYYEGGQRPGSVVLRTAAPAYEYDFLEEWRQWRDVPLTVAEAERLTGFMHNRARLGDRMTYVSSPAATGEIARIRQELGLSADRPVLVAMTNVTVDAVMFDAHRAFPSQAAWLDTCIRYVAARPELELVIRVHPAERMISNFRNRSRLLTEARASDQLRRRWPVLPANVRLVDSDSPISSYDLINMAAVLLTYASTVGLEASASGCPVLTAGRVHYGMAGLVWTVVDVADFERRLTSLLQVPNLPDHAQELARRYLYFYFFRCTPVLPGLPTLNEDVVVAPKGLLPYWESPGSPEGLREIAGYLTGTGPFIWPPEPSRPRDDGLPLPIRPPGERLAIVCCDGWETEALAESVLRPVFSSYGITRVKVVTRNSDVVTVAKRLATALANLGRSLDQIDILPSDLSRNTWCQWLAVASLLVPPRQDAAVALADAAAFGVPCLGDA